MRMEHETVSCPHTHCIAPCPNETSPRERRDKLRDEVVRRYGSKALKKGWAGGLVRNQVALELLGLAMLPGASVGMFRRVEKPGTWTVEPRNFYRGATRALRSEDHVDFEAPQTALQAAMSRIDWLKLSARWSFYRGNAAQPLVWHATRFVARISVNDGLVFFHAEWNR